MHFISNEGSSLSLCDFIDDPTRLEICFSEETERLGCSRQVPLIDDPQVSLLKDLALFISNLKYAERLGFVTNRHQLTILNASREFAATYACMATNGLQANATREIRLDLTCELRVHLISEYAISFPVEIKMANRRIGQYIGGVTMVQAFVFGYPLERIYWEFNNQMVNSAYGPCILMTLSSKYCVESWFL
ncbi:unnamed protein product [Protopolystoma xenopodis]|uniref:Ig-like domain-containing protein n=1 Tax=Protopolystoma xenopodis TaxID=117903 RepID=A0A3S5CHT7_9PLAT|nr:unnamed protein product [Protopolystoma xenopodis]